MTRTTQIDTQEQFNVVWVAFITSKRGEAEPFDERRRDARIKKALCGISSPNEEATNPPMRTLACPSSLTLEAADHKRLCDLIETYPHWNPAFSDVVVDTFDLLQAAKLED